jgi:hypothetical protein
VATALLDKPKMAKKHPTEFCTYVGTKIDDEVYPLARAAAALSGNVTVQEFISTVVNDAAAKVLNRDPIKRRPPEPKGGRKPRT